MKIYLNSIITTLYIPQIKLALQKKITELKQIFILYESCLNFFTGCLNFNCFFTPDVFRLIKKIASKFEHVVSSNSKAMTKRKTEQKIQTTLCKVKFVHLTLNHPV